MKLTLFQVDAFAEQVFAGNPAAVCPLAEWLPDSELQVIVRENNLSETAFFVRNGEAWDLRWFTPAFEVDLCGHATLASGWVLLERLEPERDVVRFHTRSGPLAVERDGARLRLDLPAQPPTPTTLDDQYAAALGGAPRETLRGGYTMIVYETEADVRALAPDMGRLAAAEPLAVSVTAPGDHPAVDFVSRFFAPSAGIPEDPVTGSAHTSLVPYWADRLGKTTLEARQLSERGGALRCELAGERVRLSGRVVPYLEGTITLEGR
jgi:PhzF family phenazine biosynthesis protein